jgi:hypothetical protein
MPVSPLLTLPLPQLTLLQLPQLPLTLPTPLAC